MTVRPVFPELVTGRHDGFPEAAWTVRVGWALRGHASCDFFTRTLEVPLGTTETDRVIRAHELMHVRVSPHDVNPLALYPEIATRALECAEECRVNELLRRVGFDVQQLSDGSETVSGQRLAGNDAWDEAVYFLAATLGTGAERAFMKGVRRARPEWTKPLGMVGRRIRAVTSSLTTDELGSTERSPTEPLGVPRGFEIATVPIARLLMSVADAAVPRDADQLRQFRRSLEPGGRRAPTGRFADLIFDTTLEYAGTARHPFGRRVRPDVSGRHLRYPSRLLTDPHRRAFARTRRSTGGIVVVDQSGSMDVDHEELDLLLRGTPGATVVGYSHRPGDHTGHPNVWVIARHGQRATTLCTGNVGNGVDGPVLRWALARRSPGDAVVWVTDGQVTDSNDHPSRELAQECARLVRRHRIRMVRTLAEAAESLRDRAVPPRDSPQNFGRVGRELNEYRNVTVPT